MPSLTIYIRDEDMDLLERVKESCARTQGRTMSKLFASFLRKQHYGNRAERTTELARKLRLIANEVEVLDT